MKTIALKEKTFELINDLKKKTKVSSFDKLIVNLIMKEEKVKPSMFGILKGKTKSFTKKEREKIWKDLNRNS